MVLAIEHDEPMWFPDLGDYFFWLEPEEYWNGNGWRWVAYEVGEDGELYDMVQNGREVCYTHTKEGQ